jgi:mannosyltransferase OCH1-like enzyme
MIPKIIHYCWLGKGEMPQTAIDCIASWHKYLPDWEFKLWNEDNFNVNNISYTTEAYAAGKYAFVSDYVRLLALESEGGIYLDTDVEVLKPMDCLLSDKAFAGFEGSKHLPVGTCVMASEANGEWITEMLHVYDNLHFLQSDGTYDMTTNVQRLTAIMASHGLRQDGSEQWYKDLHVYSVDYFSPRHTTGEYIRTENTYCDHHGLGSWEDGNTGWKASVLRLIGQKNMTKLIKLKRRLEKPLLSPSDCKRL